MGIHVIPILNAPHLPPRTIPLGHPSAPAPGILYHASNWTGNSFHIWYYTYFNAILPNHPTLALSHRVGLTFIFMWSAWRFLQVLVTLVWQSWSSPWWFHSFGSTSQGLPTGSQSAPGSTTPFLWHKSTLSVLNPGETTSCFSLYESVLCCRRTWWK